MKYKYKGYGFMQTIPSLHFKLNNFNSQILMDQAVPHYSVKASVAQLLIQPDVSTQKVEGMNKAHNSQMLSQKFKWHPEDMFYFMCMWRLTTDYHRSMA